MGLFDDIVEDGGGNDVSLTCLRGFKESLDVCDSYASKRGQMWGKVI